MWDGIAKKIRAHVADAIADREKRLKRDSRHWSETEFWPYVEDLEDELIDDDPYVDAAAAGADAMPDDAKAIDTDKTVKQWIDHVRPYAAAVPKRIAGEIADALHDVDDGDADAQAILDRIDAKLAALASSVTRYADPPWGTGQQSYGESLEANDVLLVWVLDDGADHCDDCPTLAAGSPYERGAIPTWPLAGDTQCLDRCRCVITADQESWDAAFPPA